tara:strand:- start:383 stop:1273 length:891 start_codon:yes stop_codon:yes gene_type:complete
MIKLGDFLKTQNLSDNEIKNMLGLYHTEEQTRNVVGQPICAYDLWRTDFDNKNHDNEIPNLDTDWEYFNRTHGRGFIAIDKYKYLMCFVEIPNRNKPLFTGLYKVIDKFNIEGKIHSLQGDTMDDCEEYDLKYDSRLREYEGKLILGGWQGRNIKRIIAKFKEKLFIKSILDEPPEIEFSYQEFIWSTDKISKIPHTWQNHLRQLVGVYCLVDQAGWQYIGSAYSEKGGFLGRWKEYEKNGHGGNTKLQKIPKEKRVYSVTILETAPSSYNDKQIIKLEEKWKKKLGSRAFGLNSN